MSRHLVIHLIIAFSLVFGIEHAAARDHFSGRQFSGQGNEPWNINAKTMDYSDKTGTYTAEGDVVITRGALTLRAQRAIYNTETGLAEVEGDVRLQTGEDLLCGDKGTFDFKSQTGQIHNGRLFLKENNIYANGKLLEKLDDDTYLVKDCLLTTCDGDHPAWSIKGSEVKVTVEGYGTVRDAAFRLKDYPVLYAPYLIFPAKTKRQSGLLLPSVGFSSRNGMDTEIPFFWAISDQVDATFYQHYLSKRGYMQGTELRYVSGPESKGTFLFDILSDKKEKDMTDPKDVDVSPLTRTNQTRYWLRGKADQDLPMGVTARLDADYVSDGDYLAEFDRAGTAMQFRPNLIKDSQRPMEERRSPMRTSDLRLSRDTDEYSLQGGTSYYQLPGNPIRDETAEPLGSLFFNLLRQNLSGTNLFYSVASDYDYVWREDGPEGHRFSISPGLTYPVRFGRYLEFEPSARYTLNPQMVNNENGDNGTQSLKTFEGNARLSTTMDRTYDVDIMNATRVLHRIRPSLIYTYRDLRNGDRENPWFEPLFQEDDANRVTLSVENFLDARIEGKDKPILYREWAKFTLSQGYNIEEKRSDDLPAQDKKPFEPLAAEMRIYLLPMLSILAEADWDHYDHKMSLADLSLASTIDRSGGKKDHFYLDYLYDKNNHKNINLWGEVNLIHGLSAGGSWAKDLDLNVNVSNRYWLRYLRQCWGVRFITAMEDNSTSVMVELQLFGLGSIGVK